MKLGFLFFCFLFLLLMAYSDTVELKNGDRLTGYIQSMTESHIVIQTDYGLLEIDRSFVRRAVFGEIDSDIEASTEGLGTLDAVPESAALDSVLPAEIDVLEPFLYMDFNNNFDIASQALVNVAENTLKVFADDKHGEKRSAVFSNGSGNYLILDPIQALTEANELTISFDAYFTFANRAQYLFSMWERTEGSKAEGKFALCYQQNKLVAYIVDENGAYKQYVTSGFPLETGVWHNIVVSVAPEEIIFFVDGEIADRFQTGYKQLGVGNPRLHILTAITGTSPVDYSRFNLNGSFDNLAIYTEAVKDLSRIRY